MYLVVAPRTHEVVASDAIVAGADKLTARLPDLESAIATAEANGHDVTHDQELLADLQAKVASAHDAAAACPTPSSASRPPTGTPGRPSRPSRRATRP